MLSYNTLVLLFLFLEVFVSMIVHLSGSKSSTPSISKNYRRLQPLSFSEYVSQRAVNNTVLLNLLDYGYINLWFNSYVYSNLSSYDNLVVVCMDKGSFNVVDDVLNEI